MNQTDEPIMDRTDGRLDKAIIAYRENPTPENRAVVMAAQADHTQSFMREQTGDYIERTRG